MTILGFEEISCACCGKPFEISFLYSTNNLGQEGTDFHGRALGFQPLYTEAQTCPSCGFSGSGDELKNTKLDEYLKAFIDAEIRPLLKDLKEEMIPPWISFEYAARIALWRGIPINEIGHLYHMAAWCCDDCEEKEQEKRYREKAIEPFEKALQKNEIAKNEIGRHSYLIGENYRRIGDREKAVLWYDRAIEAAGQYPGQERLVALSIQQKTDPQEFMPRCKLNHAYPVMIPRLKIWQRQKRPLWRTILLLCAVPGVLCLAYLVWSPGKFSPEGRYDLRTNGIWLQHGWLGDDSWFQRNRKNKSLFRNDRKIQSLADLLGSHGVKYVFPHVCPASPNGEIAPVDPVQTERFLDHFGEFAVIPWVGGVLGVHCSPESPQWRTNFVSSVVDLLQSHPRFAGVQVNTEPMPTGNPDFLILLDELRQAMPAGKILSVAAYPPPTRWHPFPEGHWEESYFKQVAQRADQLAPMMYDTAIMLPKFYQHLMSGWTSEVLNWAGNTQVLLGIPVYDDAGVGYHFPHVENLQNALAGIHAGLSKYKTLPKNYAGIAIYCEWEMDLQEWNYLKEEFAGTQ